jgi:hypothetical protein
MIELEISAILIKSENGMPYLWKLWGLNFVSVVIADTVRAKVLAAVGSIRGYPLPLGL